MNSQSDIQKLLQLKRHKTPPAEFHEKFLMEFQRRQRADLLRRTLKPSLRETFLDRLSLALTSSLQVPSLAYVSIAIIGILVSIAIWFHFPGDTSRHPMAFIDSKKHSFDGFSLKPPVAIPRQQTVGSFPPSYNLENHPANYEAPLSF